MEQTCQDDTRTELSRPGEHELTMRMVEKGKQQQQGGISDSPPLARVMGVGRQKQPNNHSHSPHKFTTTDIKTNMRHIKASIVSRQLATRGNNKIMRTPPLHISSSEEMLHSSHS